MSILGRLVLEENNLKAHVNEMKELFQKLLALYEQFTKPEFTLTAILIGSLPESYNYLAAKSQKSQNYHLVQLFSK